MTSLTALAGDQHESELKTKDHGTHHLLKHLSLLGNMVIFDLWKGVNHAQGYIEDKNPLKELHQPLSGSCVSKD